MIEAWEQRYSLTIRRAFPAAFFVILAIKIIVGTLFASDFFTKGFAPFVSYFVTSHFHDPYQFFASIHQIGAFPYPPVMLVILSIFRGIFSPVLSHHIGVVGFGQLFVLHLPILLADVFIYFVLCQWLQTKESKVLSYYWASPVLFFINYFHGQLDVIPMAILFASLWLLFRRQTTWAFVFLGLSIATKTHLIAVLPFYAIYLYVNRAPLGKIAANTLIALAVFGLCLLPLVHSTAFVGSVFGTEEAKKVFLVSLPFLHQNLQLLLAPLVILILFFNFYYYKKLNRDAFLLILGLLFTVFVVFVPPMPGWFYWSIPFFVYYFAKYRDTPHLSFWFLNLAYLAYVVLASDSHFFSSFSLVAPHLANLATPFALLAARGFDMTLIANLIFTGLVAAVVMNATWIYRTGVRSNLQYKIADSPLTLGIGGDSGAGKTTLAKTLRQTFGEGQSVMIEGDDAHKWERGDKNWRKQTHLNPKSNRLHQELSQAGELQSGSAISRAIYDHDTGRFTAPQTVEPGQVLIFLGLHPFYLSRMRRLIDIKIFVEPDEKLRRHWKIVRDRTSRGKTKAEVLAQIKSRETDSKKYIRPQRQFADIVVSLYPLEKLSAEKKPKLGLRLTADNSLVVDPLLEALSPINSLRAEHWYEDDLERQCLQFVGRARAEELNEAARRLLPNLDELVRQPPVWQADYDGICQLFVLYFYSELAKTEPRSL